MYSSDSLDVSISTVTRRLKLSLVERR